MSGVIVRTDLICEHCGSDQQVCVSTDSKPSLQELLGDGSENVRRGGTPRRAQVDHVFWDGASGAGFNDQYLETFVLGAKENGGQDSEPIQLHLTAFAEFAPDSSYQLNSFWEFSSGPHQGIRQISTHNL